VGEVLEGRGASHLKKEKVQVQLPEKDGGGGGGLWVAEKIRKQARFQRAQGREQNLGEIPTVAELFGRKETNQPRMEKKIGKNPLRK